MHVETDRSKIVKRLPPKWQFGARYNAIRAMFRELPHVSPLGLLGLRFPEHVGTEFSSMT